MAADNQQATVMNLLVAHENMDDQIAYNIVKTMFDQRDELIRVHKEAENFKLENQKTRGVADSVASRRAQVLQGEGRQAQLKWMPRRKPRSGLFRKARIAGAFSL